MGATLGTLVLVTAIFFLARSPGAPGGMRFLGWAFAANMGRYVLMLLLPQQSLLTWLITEAVHGLFAILLLAGVSAFTGRWLGLKSYAAVFLGFCLYLLLASVGIDDPMLRSVPPYFVIGGMMLASAGMFWGHDRRHPRQGYWIVAAILAVWGLHKFDYPWLGDDPLWTALGYMFAQVMATASALTVIIIAGRHQLRFNDQVRADIAATVSKATASERQLDALLVHLADGVITVDEQGNTLSVNPAAARIFGRIESELLGRPVAWLLPDPDAPDVAGGLVVKLAEAPPQAGREVMGRRHDGLLLPLEMTVSQIAVDGQKSYVAILRDISGRKLLAGAEALVQEFNQRLLQGDHLDHLTLFVCSEIVKLFGAGTAWIARREPDGRILTTAFAGPDSLDRYLRGLALRWDAGPLSQGPAGRAIRMQTTQLVGPDSPDWLGVLGPYSQLGLRAGLSIPLLAGQQIVGALSVYFPRFPESVVLRRLDELASRIGIALLMMNDQRRLRLQGAAMAAAANAIFITNAKGQIEWVNDAFTRLSGYGLDEAVGQTPKILRSGAQTDAFYHDLLSTIAAGKVWRGELVERRKDGTLYTVEQTVTPMRDVEGAISYYVAVHEDITERKRAEERIKYLSSYDALTGLPNRALFRERLRQAVARSEVTSLPMAVLFLDLDHFSRINDTMGHELGDRLLAEIVSRLSGAARNVDTLARVGGDEFAAILCDDASAEGAANLARRMLAAISLPYDLDGHEIHVGASVGIAVYPEDGREPDHLIKNADMAMYRAIREAPNGYRFFSNAMNEEMRARVTLERDLRRALTRNEFELHYQPQLDILTGRMVGMEALVRWRHPEQGMIPPGRFIPLAEETGLIIPLGDQVLHMACAQIRSWLNQGLPMVPVAVNLSAIQMRRETLIEDIMKILQDNGIDSRWLELELTESGVMEDAEAAERTLRELSGQGIKLAIDDFGTGYSSLSYPKRFPISKLKIDRSFVSSLEDEGGNDAAIARAIITLGHSLGMTVVSEGVETQAQLAYLRANGCDTVQGYLFSKPVPAADIPPMLQPVASPTTH